MPLTYDVAARTLALMDPFHWTWSPPQGPLPPGTARLQRRLVRLQAIARTEQAGRGMGDIAHQLSVVDPGRTFGLFPDVPPLDGRRPLVLAHGPSLATLLPTLRTHRHHLYIVAPFRSALRLALADVWADVAVLADAAAITSAASQDAWHAAPIDVRTRFEQRVTLLADPLAPACIHAAFARVRVFDDGLGWLPRSAELPFWGSATLPAICVPLALGASTVSIGGMDMTADHGRRCRTWQGHRVRMDPRQTVSHGVLEALATALPGRLIDVSGQAVAKRGFEHVNLEQWIERPGTAPGRPAVGAPTVRAVDVLRRTLKTAESFRDTIERMRAIAVRVCDLSSADPTSPELPRLVEQMETDWANEPAYRSALSLVQPPYLKALWELRAAGFVSQNPRTSARMKARLVGPEIAALGPAFETWLATFREAVQEGPRGAGHAQGEH